MQQTIKSIARAVLTDAVDFILGSWPIIGALFGVACAIVLPLWLLARSAGAL